MPACPLRVTGRVRRAQPPQLVPAPLSPRADGAISRSEAQPRGERGEGPCVPEQREMEQRELPPDACAGEAPAGSPPAIPAASHLVFPPTPFLTPGMSLLLPQQSQTPRTQVFEPWPDSAPHCVRGGRCE